MSHIAYVCKCFYSPLSEDGTTPDLDYEKVDFVNIDNVDNCIHWADNRMHHLHIGFIVGIIHGYFVTFNADKQYYFCSCRNYLINIGQVIQSPQLENQHMYNCLMRFDFYLQERKEHIVPGEYIYEIHDLCSDCIIEYFDRIKPFFMRCFYIHDCHC